ncbi:hypothetical protein L6452_36104 [Arctium lappa]|uniref:Uncharacterized protein n=1 Tax=Arctium lappa TaxID=4217 RepID=A0ACB8Y8X5_ARCLA|nr:hypothetical protein L6452_36104 [Arctium lappa]
MSKNTRKDMTWHYDHETELGVIVHPSDGAVWNYFDTRNPDFASEIQNVRLGLCTEVIPGRKSPDQNFDVFLRPLIDKLKMLYKKGVLTYDAYHKNNFEMKAILLWIVSDFPAYAMFLGWSTHDKLACP